MKNNLSIILSAVALIVAVVFGILYMSSDKSAGSSVPTDSSDSTAVAAEGAIVYIDLDRIFQEYDMANDLRSVVETRCRTYRRKSTAGERNLRATTTISRTR